MRCLKPVSHRSIVACAAILGLEIMTGIGAWALVSATAFAEDKAESKEITVKPKQASDKSPQKEKINRGRFVSLKQGTLTIEANSGDLIETKISDNTKILVWNTDETKYVPRETAVALKEIKVGAWVIIDAASESVTIRIGSRKGKTTGTFVSFKNDRLLMLGKDLGESFTKKYGNNIHFNKFRDDVPVHESVDGGEYQLIGTANKVLGSVKEGSIVSVHGEGDDNITLIEIGVPKSSKSK